MMTASLETGGSFDTAARDISSNGPLLSSELFSEAVREADAKRSPGISCAVREALDALPAEASGYRQAIFLCMAASESSNRADMASLLKEASDTALESVRRMGESYSASLTFPCMTIFSMGIMVPMILMSLMPMMDMGGMFGSGFLNRDTVAAITLMAIPAVILLITMDMRAKNPFSSRRREKDVWRLFLPLLSSIPLGAVYVIFSDGEMAILFAMVPACVITMILAHEEYKRDRRMSVCDSEARECIYDLGNRMSSGENFESAAVAALSSRQGCAVAGHSLEKEIRICKGDTGFAVVTALSGLSAELRSAVEGIERCSRIDLRDAGSLAVSLGRQFQNRKATLAALETGMKSMTDMMMGTAMVFAPLILGLSMSMMRPLSRISGYSGIDGGWWILGLYLVELCALISLLISSLGRDDSFAASLWRFCLMCPVSLIVFTVSCTISL